MYRLIIFDADHTLFDFDRAEKEAMKKLCSEIGHELNEIQYSKYREINFSLWKKFERDEIDQTTIKVERFRLFFEEIGLDADFMEISHRFLIYLSEGSYLLNGALELIKSLKDKFSLVLLTNGISIVQHPRYDNSELYGMFDSFVVSGDLGINKPDKRIFEHALNDFPGIHAGKTLMIGDSLTSDIKGGINAGMDTCWYNPGQKENDQTFCPTYEIKDLKDIQDILEK